MGFTNNKEFLKCRIASNKGVQIQKPLEKLSYTTLIENLRKFLAKFGVAGRFSEKSFKVSRVSEALNQGISMEDAVFHWRWKILSTPGYTVIRTN